jgi:hypothetical protein
VVYRGTVPRHPGDWALDAHHRFTTGKVVAVCGNTARMLRDTRFAPHFDLLGDGSRHLGIFAGGGTGSPFGSDADRDTSATSCC